MCGKRGSFPPELIGIGILAVTLCGSCTYRERTLKRAEEIKFKDGDYDVVVGPDSRGGDETPSCPKGFTGPNCRACDTGYVPYQGDKCLPSCNTDICGDHGDCGVLAGGDPICICDEGWDGDECDRCADQWLLHSDDCVKNCAISSLDCGHGTCKQDPLPLYCECDPGYGEPFCQTCAVGYIMIDSGQCVQTCQGLGWQNCGDEATCSVDMSSGDVSCGCLPLYQVYQDEDSNLTCMPTCDAVDLSCWSITDGTSRGACDIIAGEAQCDCALGYQDEDRNGTCEPGCQTSGGDDFCTNASACTLGGPHGGAICACNAGTQDHNGDGICESDCGSSVCDIQIGGGSWDFVGCRYDESGEQTCRHVLYIDKANQWPPGDGKTWDTAFVGFAEAAAAITAGGTSWTEGFDIWVAEGTYPIATPISLTANVHLYGGFPNAGTPTFEQRDPEAYATILEGTAGLILLATGDGIRIDGLTVQGGDAPDDTGPSSQGGALRAAAANGLTVFKCNFYSNSAAEGGAVYLENSVDTTFVDAVWFANQTSGGADRGGALRVNGGGLTLISSLAIDNNAGSGGGLSATNAEIEIKGTLFTFNVASSGGAAHITGGQASIDRIEVVSNSGGGGALVLEDVANASIQNGLFLSNGSVTSSAAGALKIDGPDAGSNEIHLQNSTFVDNAAGPGGSRSVSVYERRVRMFNTIAWGNHDGDQLKVEGGLLDVNYALVKGGLCGSCDGDHVQNTAPIFTEFEASHNGTSPNGQSFVHVVSTTTTTLEPDALKGKFILPKKDLPSKRWSLIIGNSEHEITFLGDSNLDVTSTTMLVSDFTLAVDSPGIDAGDGDHAPDWDHRLNPRHDVLGLPNSGQGRPAFVDLGCFETQIP